MADDGSQKRKPDFRTAMEDVKALATVLVIEAEGILRRRLSLRSPAVLFAIGVVVTLVLAVVVVVALLRTGDAQAVSDNAPLIAAVIALGGVGTAQMVSIALDDRRTQEARDLEAQRAGEAALQNYFENVGEVLIEKPLHRASPGDSLSAVVRAQTLSVLEGLDPDRKRILLMFLHESGLIDKDKPVVSLSIANLSGASLDGASLDGANLSRAYLIGANLSRANLFGAYLIGASLDGANLSGANLIGAYLTGANLSRANLIGANLSRAYLIGANLSEANLFGATGITNEQLEQQAYSLEGAIMPDDAKHP